MSDRTDPDAVQVATIDSVHAARLLRKARAFHTARGRVHAADRHLSQALHPATRGTLTKDQQERLILARDLIRSVTPDLHTLADVNPPADALVAAAEAYRVPPPARFVPKVAPAPSNVVVLAARRRSTV